METAHTLSLEWAAVTVALSDPPSNVDYLDFVIDEQPLRDWITWLQGEHVNHFSGSPSRFTRSFDAKHRKLAHDQLLLRAPAPFQSGHVPLYVCPCGDLQCGCLTVHVERVGDRVVWSGFGVNGAPRYCDMPAFSFEWDAYGNALRAGRL